MGILSFFDRFKASSSDRSAWGDFFFEPVSVRSVSGMRVSPDSAMRLAAGVLNFWFLGRVFDRARS